MAAGKSSATRTSPRNAALREFTEHMSNLIKGLKLCVADNLREQGLTLPQLRMLGAADAHPNASAAEIARIIDVTPQTLQAMLRRAERERWITRGSSPTNHRVVTVELAPAGRRVLEQGRALSLELQTQIWQGVPVADLTRINELLARAVERLQAELQRT